MGYPLNNDDCNDEPLPIQPSTSGASRRPRKYRRIVIESDSSGEEADLGKLGIIFCTILPFVLTSISGP